MAVRKRQQAASDGREAAPVAPRPVVKRAPRAGDEVVAQLAAAWLEDAFPLGLPEGFM